MELLVTLRNTNNIEKILSSSDGIIIGSKFTTGFDYSLSDIEKIVRYCKENKRKVYIVMDDFIAEEELMALNSYLEFIRSLDVDGIYFHDLAVYEASSVFGLRNKLIYDGKTVLCNSLETSYYLSKGLNGVVISRELTLDEVKKIVYSHPNQVDMQVFGHLRLSYSKRKFISNYQKQIKDNSNLINSKNLTLVEELRDYPMPIIEDQNGTKIYSDYIFMMYDEFRDLKDYLGRAIIDSLFISDNALLQVVRDYRKVTKENISFLRERIKQSFPDNYASGYLYLKTNITKEDEKD